MNRIAGLGLVFVLMAAQGPGFRAWAGMAAPAVQKNRQQIMAQQKPMAQQYRQRQGPGGGPETFQEAISEEELARIWDSLKDASHAWLYIEDERVKEYLVGQYITLYKQRGITITKDPAHYATMIDEMAANTPPMFKLPFLKILQIVAAMEYDFDFGQDKDKFARDVLGEDAYRSNRQRLGLE